MTLLYMDKVITKNTDTNQIITIGYSNGYKWISNDFYKPITTIE